MGSKEQQRAIELNSKMGCRKGKGVRSKESSIDEEVKVELERGFFVMIRERENGNWMKAGWGSSCSKDGGGDTTNFGWSSKQRATNFQKCR